MKRLKKPFIFNDESLRNNYGFFILTKGIDLKRFKKNPVMLDNHNWVSNEKVLGRWEAIKEEDGKLLGFPVFDDEDLFVEKIAGKVERGVIRGCSMGISFKSEDLKRNGEALILEKCELLEVSITPLPSNPNSVILYADGNKERLSDEAIKTICLNASKPISKHNKSPEMSKITLTVVAAVALGLGSNLEIEADELSQKIVDLKAAKDAAELRLSTLQSQKETETLQRITGKVEAAIKAGKVEAPRKEEFVNLGIANEAILDSTLAAIPAKTPFSGKLTSSGGAEEVKTKEDFVRLHIEQQLSFKQNHPDTYKRLFS